MVFYLFIFVIVYVSGDGKKNIVPKTGDKAADKQLQPAATTVLRSLSTAPPPRNSTNATTAIGLVAAAPGTSATPLEMSNVTHSSALDDAQLQRTLLKPKFLTENSSTVVAQTGASSRISCLVANLGDCVVS